uniref:BRCT domain-containing protein n=1 Tax=Loa loa TaxID=7209 RepID=A0A1I7VUR3_LOALO
MLFSNMHLQIPMTQAISSPLQLPQNQSRKLLRKESKNAKRRINHSQHKSAKMQRIDEIDDSNSVTGISVNTYAGTSTVKHNPYVAEDAIVSRSATKSLFKQLQINSKESSNSIKEATSVGIQTDEKEMQHKSQQTSVEDATCSPLYVKGLNFNASAMHDGKIQMNNSGADALVQIEGTVNSVLEGSKNQSRIEVLIKCIPWIPGFLRLGREALIDAVCEAKAEKKFRDENFPSKIGNDLVLESDEERELAVPINNSYTIDCCHSDAQQSKGRNTEQSTVAFLKDKQCCKEDNEVYHSMMVSGASKLGDQSLLRRFLDNFSSFKLSTSISRKCTYLVIFNTDGLICEFWTVKLIYALVNHCTIVSYSWLENCLNQKSILPTHDFEILLKIDETLIDITAQRALTDPSTLFDGYIFYVPQTFFNTQLIARDVFLEIVELSGGKTVSHVWELPSERSYIIFAPDCFNQDAARRFELDMKKEVLKADWIFASIGQHRILDREPYRIIHLMS